MMNSNKSKLNLDLLKSKIRMVVKVTCDRCNGVGRIPRYNHVEGGICFKCRGSKEFVKYV
jgi:DnaJ-class molecular chaperone